MVQNPKYWKAEEYVRFQNKTELTIEKCDFSFFTFPNGVLSDSISLQYFGYCTM